MARQLALPGALAAVKCSEVCPCKHKEGRKRNQEWAQALAATELIDGNAHLQVRRWTLEGRRPEVPPHEALPGPDSPRWPGLDAYCALMR